MSESQSDITLIIQASYNIIIFGMVLKWFIPELRRWREHT